MPDFDTDKKHITPATTSLSPETLRAIDALLGLQERGATCWRVDAPGEARADDEDGDLPPEKFKDDAGKVRFDLLSPEFLEQMARVMTVGAEKYGERTWDRISHPVDRYTAALYRHLNAFHQGNDADPDDGISHLAHVAVNAMFLYQLIEHGGDSDVRS